MMVSTNTTSPLRKAAFFIIITTMICCSIQAVIASSTSLTLSSSRHLKKNIHRNSNSSSSIRSSLSSDPGLKGSQGRTRRVTLFARITLLNLDMEEITPEHLIYFENEFMDAFNELQQDSTTKNDDDKYGYGPRIRSLIVQDVVKGNSSSGRRRRGRFLREGGGDLEAPDHDRSLSFYYEGPFFDFEAFFEVACTLCRSDDDDGRRILFQNSDNDDNVTTAAAAHRLFEKTLLNRLRGGKFPEFRNIEELKIVYLNE